MFLYLIYLVELKMGFELATLWSPWIIFGVASIVVVIAIITLTIVENILDKKIRRKKEWEEKFFREKIEYLKNREGRPEQFLVAFNEIVLEVFKETLGLGRDIMYEEASALFKKRGDLRASKFAEKIQTMLYSGEKIDKEKLDSLLNELVFLISKFREANQEEVIGKASGFEDYFSVFLDKVNKLKEEFRKFDKVKESVEEEIGVLKRGAGVISKEDEIVGGVGTVKEEEVVESSGRKNMCLRHLKLFLFQKKILNIGKLEFLKKIQRNIQRWKVWMT